MLGDIKHVITDFGVGGSVTKGEGIHIKIGVSNIESDIPITITDAMRDDEIKQKIGNSPLANSLIDSLAAGCKTIYALPVSIVTQGVITKDSTTDIEGVTISGSPTNEFKIELEIVATGGRNEGIFKYYIDGLASEENTIPINGNYNIDAYGIIINFTEKDFHAGERVAYKTTAPKTSVEKIIQALEIIKNTSLDFEFIHIVGESEKELWASLTIEEQNFFDKYFKPCIFVVETRKMLDDESIDQYAQYLREERKGIVSRGLQIVASRCNYTRDGKVCDINVASLIMGLYARSSVQQSIGQVDTFDIKGATEILPKGIINITSELDDLGYTTIREYSGVEGIYINNARTMAKEGSDYEFIERTRTMYKAVRETRKTALMKMHTQVDMEKPEVSIKQITEFINVPVERMVENKELSTARVIIPEGQDILGTSILTFKIRAMPIGILREIEIDMGFENNV